MEAEKFLDSPYKDIISIISTGKENAKHGNEIAPLLGMDTRELRKHLEYLRRNGVVIVGDVRSGYYFPANLYELESYVRQEEARARSTLYTLKTARALRKRWSDKMSNLSIFD